MRHFGHEIGAVLRPNPGGFEAEISGQIDIVAKKATPSAKAYEHRTPCRMMLHKCRIGVAWTRRSEYSNWAGNWPANSGISW